MTDATSSPLLSVRDLSVAFRSRGQTTLAVDKANSATTAATATNANALGGKSLAQVQTVIAGNQNASVVGDIGAGTDTVTVAYTLAAAG